MYSHTVSVWTCENNESVLFFCFFLIASSFLCKFSFPGITITLKEDIDAFLLFFVLFRCNRFFCFFLFLKIVMLYSNVEEGTKAKKQTKKTFDLQNSLAGCSLYNQLAVHGRIYSEQSSSVSHSTNSPPLFFSLHAILIYSRRASLSVLAIWLLLLLLFPRVPLSFRLKYSLL